MSGEPVTLQSLAFEWGDTYVLSYVRDRWVALRRETHRFLDADTLAGLEHAIEDDYRHHPVSRDFDPPGATDYLDGPDYDTDDDADDDAEGYDEYEPDYEPGLATGLTVLHLRDAFPRWDISYSPQSRAWIARGQTGTICVNSAALLWVALMLIERGQRRAGNGPGPDGPPWTGISLS